MLSQLIINKELWSFLGKEATMLKQGEAIDLTNSNHLMKDLATELTGKEGMKYDWLNV